jgi:tryptophan synthase alpha chain
MQNRLDKLNGNFSIMTHVVAGYPDIDTCEDIVLSMVKKKVSLIEIQIPFSDPLADGPTIMKANQISLDKGTSVNDCFDLVAKLRKEIDIPLLFMSYANILYNYGIKEFIAKCKEIGADGLIVPDIPFDENLEYIQEASKNNIYPIQVVSPDIEVDRLKEIIKIAQGFIYTTLKVGITGAGKEVSQAGIDFIKTIKKLSNIPILAGFGISSIKHVENLRGLADGAIIGSHLLNLYNSQGISAIENFLEELIN